MSSFAWIMIIFLPTIAFLTTVIGAFCAWGISYRKEKIRLLIEIVINSSTIKDKDKYFKILETELQFLVPLGTKDIKMVYENAILFNKMHHDLFYIVNKIQNFSSEELKKHGYFIDYDNEFYFKYANLFERYGLIKKDDETYYLSEHLKISYQTRYERKWLLSFLLEFEALNKSLFGHKKLSDIRNSSYYISKKKQISLFSKRI